MKQNGISILLVDDHEVVRAGFKILLSAQPFIGEIRDVNRGELVAQEYARMQPDVVVMDLSMPGIGGLETIRRLCRQAPDAVVLVYSIHDEFVYVERALQAGARGYVSKNSAAEMFCRLASGMTTHEAASDLCLGYKTVANYNTKIKSKLRVNTAAELANIAVVLGIVKP